METKSAQVSKGFAWLFVFFSSWQVLGVFLDGWAHLHLSSAQETIFTPWHGVFYSGFAAVSGLLLFTLWRNHRAGYSWRNALPREYWLSLVGVGVFMVAAIGDLVWHAVFGIEVGIDALLSPTHLLLAFAGAIMVSGPLHSIWYRDVKQDQLHKGPALISLCLILLTLTFMTQFLHPYYFPFMSTENHATGVLFSKVDMQVVLSGGPVNPLLDVRLEDVLSGVGIANLLIYCAIIVGLALSVIRFIDLPAGSFTLMFFLEALGMAVLKEQYWFIVSALVAGLLVDLLYFAMRHRLHEVKMLRTFGFLVPVSISLSYLGVIALVEGIWWNAHLIAGAAFMSGIAGLLLTYLVLPPGDHFIPRRKW